MAARIIVLLGIAGGFEPPTTRRDNLRHVRPVRSPTARRDNLRHLRMSTSSVQLVSPSLPPWLRPAPGVFRAVGRVVWFLPRQLLRVVRKPAAAAPAAAPDAAAAAPEGSFESERRARAAQMALREIARRTKAYDASVAAARDRATRLVATAGTVVAPAAAAAPRPAPAAAAPRPAPAAAAPRPAPAAASAWEKKAEAFMEARGLPQNYDDALEAVRADAAEPAAAAEDDAADAAAAAPRGARRALESEETARVRLGY